MNKFFVYILLFLLGLIIGLFLLEKYKKDYRAEQVEIIQNGIINVSKLVVVEETYTEFYSYSDSNKYFFETIGFDKKVILTVSVKVLVSYNLKKMETEIDSVHRKIIIHEIPEPELIIVPNFKYYDLEQSVFNTFTKEELNMIQKSSIDKIRNNLKVAHSKEKAKERLLIELNQLWTVAKIMGWTVEDKTNQLMLDSIFNPSQKDVELNLK